MAEVLVCKRGELADGAVRIVYFDKHEIAVILQDGAYYAYRNVCPHQGGPACEGIRVPRVIDVVDEHGAYHGQSYDKEQMHIVCPWHGYEFNLKTGEHPGNNRIKLKKYDIVERGGEVYVAV